MHITLDEFITRYYELLGDVYIHVFAAVILLDILTGLGKAWVTKSLNSTIGRGGVLEHLLVMVLGISLYPYLNLIGFDEIAKGFVIFFVASYGISVVENLAEIGVPIPKWVRTRLEKIRDAFDDDSTGGGK
nr:MAG TPA: holin [Caudoviricetes sp.]